jgi:mRNA interferase MazF
LNRGELFLVQHPTSQDPKKSRVFVVVSRQILVDSKFSTVICAPIYSRYDSLSTQIIVGIDEGLKHQSSIHCDELVSIPKNRLTNYIGKLSDEQLANLNEALKIALDIFE